MVKNTLAYYGTDLITLVKSFIEQSLRWKVQGTAVTNTLAYYSMELITTVKSFIELSLVWMG